MRERPPVTDVTRTGYPVGGPVIRLVTLPALRPARPVDRGQVDRRRRSAPWRRPHRPVDAARSAATPAPLLVLAAASAAVGLLAWCAAVVLPLGARTGVLTGLVIAGACVPAGAGLLRGRRRAHPGRRLSLVLLGRGHGRLRRRPRPSTGCRR